MNRTTIIYFSYLLFLVLATVCTADDRDRDYNRRTTTRPQASPPPTLPPAPTISSQQTSRDRRGGSRSTQPQGTQAMQVPPVVNLNDLQTGETSGIQTMTIVMPPSPFNSEQSEQEKAPPQEPQGEVAQQAPHQKSPAEQDVAESIDSDQPVAEVSGPSIAIGYYAIETPPGPEKNTIYYDNTGAKIQDK